MECLSRFGAAALILLAVGVGCSPKPVTAQASPAEPPSFIENDYKRALADARQANLPLFVEVWAPW